MATRKTAAPAEEKIQEEVQEIVPEDEKAEDGAIDAVPEVDPWTEMVPVMVPRARKNEDQNAYVCVNDRRFYIPRNGKTQQMPRPIAEALQESLEAEYRADEYAESIVVNEPVPGKIG